MVLLAWPQERQLDLTRNPQQATRLVNLFFLSQYVLASLLAPTFAAGAITGEKERKTYEMLLASPLRPGAIVLGKLLASLVPLGILIFSSLPIVVLALPLGGVSIYEVLAAYAALGLSIVTFGMISVACSSFFRRTAASLVVSYLLILPLALAACDAVEHAGHGSGRPGALAVERDRIAGRFARRFALRCFKPRAGDCCIRPTWAWRGMSRSISSKKSREAVGMIIQRDQFPDRLFAPAKRTALLPDGANPVYDKEMRSEIFAQGTLMLRVVIQVSMLLAIPIMALCLFWRQELAAWYIGYVVLFNMLVGPVFSAGAITGERERQTLELLLTTIISPWQILWGKLLSGLRVSSVLTLFLLWPLVLAIPLSVYYWGNLPSMAAYVGIVLVCCATTTTIALFCSVIFRKTVHSMIAAYLAIATLYCVPLAVRYFAETFFYPAATSDIVQWTNFTSPFAAAFAVPLTFGNPDIADRVADWPLYFSYLGFSIALVVCLLAAMIWLFNRRWRVAE